MMRTLLVFFGILFSVLLLGCDTSEDITGTPISDRRGESLGSLSKLSHSNSGTVVIPSVIDGSVSLWSDRTVNVGSVSLTRDDENFYLQYSVTGSAELRETHLDVSDVAFTERGAPGRYAYQQRHSSGTQSYTYTIPITWNAGTTIYFRAHADIGTGKKSSSAFAGAIITPQRGAWYGLFSTTLPAPPTTFSISGSAFTDSDGDGSRSAGELGISGVTISLSTGETATTDVDGNYSFSGLDPGTYSVLSSSLDGMAPTSTLTKKVSITAENVSAHFGYTPEP